MTNKEEAMNPPARVETVRRNGFPPILCLMVGDKAILNNYMGNLQFIANKINVALLRSGWVPPEVKNHLLDIADHFKVCVACGEGSKCDDGEKYAKALSAYAKAREAGR